MITSPLGALLPITFQYPKGTHKSIIENTSFISPNPLTHLTFFQKLRKCVNRIVGYICIPFTGIAVKGATVVLCIVESLFQSISVFSGILYSKISESVICLIFYTGFL